MSETLGVFAKSGDEPERLIFSLFDVKRLLCCCQFLSLVSVTALKVGIGQH